MPLRVAGAQLNLVVGDIEGNESRIVEAIRWAEAENADVLLLPELAINGYPPEDLVLRDDFVQAGIDAIQRIAALAPKVVVLVGYVDRAVGPPRGAPDSRDRNVSNSVAVVGSNGVIGRYDKVLLPNYGVFDEDRYFTMGTNPGRVWDIAGVVAGVSICEDIWRPDGPPQVQAESGARILLNINASPFHRGKAEAREEMLRQRAVAAGAPVVYLNLVGGQDELVFDGASCVLDATGQLIHRSPQFEEDQFVIDIPLATESLPPGVVVPLLSSTEEVYRALVTGLKDYVNKNGFSDVALGLSGGIDSALTATIAADALGGSSVWGIAMPSRFSSSHSLEDAEALANNLGLNFHKIPIDGIFSSFLETLTPLFEGHPFDVAEENLQARARGVVLMAISNKFGPMVLATGNKSEMAAGYATLYGDMVGGFSVLKDVFKTEVYELAEWRNQQGMAIPRRSIDKAPSAELRPDQKDSDSLPPYPVFDAILERYIEQDLGVAEIVKSGFDPELVLRVARMVDRNEYKRRQASPGVRVTTKAFGKDRRLPITNAFRSELN